MRATTFSTTRFATLCNSKGRVIREGLSPRIYQLRFVCCQQNWKLSFPIMKLFNAYCGEPIVICTLGTLLRSSSPAASKELRLLDFTLQGSRCHLCVNENPGTVPNIPENIAGPSRATLAKSSEACALVNVFIPTDGVKRRPSPALCGSLNHDPSTRKND